MHWEKNRWTLSVESCKTCRSGFLPERIFYSFSPLWAGLTILVLSLNLANSSPFSASLYQSHSTPIVYQSRHCVHQDFLFAGQCRQLHKSYVVLFCFAWSHWLKTINVIIVKLIFQLYLQRYTPFRIDNVNGIKVSGYSYKNWNQWYFYYQAGNFLFWNSVVQIILQTGPLWRFFIKISQAIILLFSWSSLTFLHGHNWKACMPQQSS